MLVVKGEGIFDEKQPTKIAWSYFRDGPFKDDFGIAYMNGGIKMKKGFKILILLLFIMINVEAVSRIISLKIIQIYL